MATLLSTNLGRQSGEAEPGGQMSFLEHLDELRTRLIRSFIFVIAAAIVCWFTSDRIYRFLAIPIERALVEAQSRQAQISGITGSETILSPDALKEGDVVRYVFGEETRLGSARIPPGASVVARYTKDVQGRPGLFTDEPLFANNAVIPKGVRLDIDISPRHEGRLIVNTAIEPFSLYVKVSLYAAVAVSLPFLLWQIWAFVSPGLYPHERKYVFPFIGLSTISFVIGAIFAYYVIFPPAARYLLGLGRDFRLLLKADDYFDFIIVIMLGMGLIFQMPAITYVLSRIGLVSAELLVKIWKTAIIVILIVAAVVSPTNDIPNMLLFAAPMLALYVVSIFVAWIFGKPRTTT